MYYDLIIKAGFFVFSDYFYCAFVVYFITVAIFLYNLVLCRTLASEVCVECAHPFRQDREGAEERMTRFSQNKGFLSRN